MKKEELYKLAIETYGDEAQINQGIEEMAELIQAVNKFRRDIGTWHDVVEEIVDVEIMMEQYKIIFEISEDKISRFKNKKLNRLAERLEASERD